MKPILEDSENIISSLKRKLELKGMSTELRIISVGKSEFVEEGYDNWNGDQYFYTLYVDIPIELFVEIEDKIADHEKRVLQEVQSLRRGESSEHITVVTIRSASEILSPEGILSDTRTITPIPEFWEKDRFRLFISHTSSAKEHAFKLKISLIQYYISCFVAHEDIEPTKEWQIEIEKALTSMDAITALITAEFNSSCWCDQEVGFAIGRKRLVIPIRMGHDPYGFFGKYQGLSGKKKNSDQIASEIFTVIAKHNLTKIRMATLLVERLALSNTYAESKGIIDYLERSPVITSEMGKKMQKAIEENDKVRSSYYVPGRIDRLLKRHGHSFST